jgi:hypothetical protein
MSVHSAYYACRMHVLYSPPPQKTKTGERGKIIYAAAEGRSFITVLQGPAYVTVRAST